MKLIWKLLRSNISPLQLGGFLLANLLGMLIIFLCIQAYSDIRPMFSGGNSLLKKDYLVVTKKVSTFGMLLNKNTSFSAGELKEITDQSFVKSLGRFTSSAYHVTAGIDIKGMGFATEMFFESVPDEYVDVKPADWHFSEKEGVIPIIIPRNYLNLYNFGFAQSRNLPKISEGVVEMVRLDIEISGNGQRKNLKGRITGFSDRLNTILVPEQFMEWANKTYAPDKDLASSRLIMEVLNPSDKYVLDFFKDKGYEVEEGKLDSGRTLWFLNVVTMLVVGIGIVICLLSVYILMLSIYLLLQKNSTKLENLLLLGYKIAQVARPYQRLTIVLNGVVLFITLVLVFLIRNLYTNWLREQWPEFVPGSVWTLLIFGVLFYLVIITINTLAIQKKIKGLAG
ncbi:ABC transporter permease [Odoribacter sp. OttesenSCG-928-J03]|nr:ABC transporter permease [Odoribacter sp. OttesenSCG-928-J03]MDL2283218.1 ABC transporter permease [Odoribacter sp. OttesenSCG-928-G04]